MKKMIVSAILITATLAACKTAEKSTTASTPTPAKPAAPLPAGTLMYATDIKPIMDMYCVRCHNDNEKAGYNFKEIAFVKKAGANGELLGTIKHMDNFDPMPANQDKMDDATIAKIESWIKSGMN